MAEHIYKKEDLVNRFDNILGITLEKIDNKGFFDRVQAYSLQKGVAGSLIEQCVLGYEPDSKQEADLIVIDGDKNIRTELKTTGMVLSDTSRPHFVAKEPMSITAVGVYDIADQTFETSHFWEKLEHMLIVYYHYLANHPVEAYDYRTFPIKGYEFHEFEKDEIEALRQDWEHVRELVARIVSHYPGEHTKEWKEAVKQEYIDTHGELRRVLNYVDLAPKFPPRFRLKKPIVSSIISKHFGYELEQLPGRYTSVSDIDAKCEELTKKYKGKTIKQLAESLNITVLSSNGKEKKGIVEEIAISMFGGKSKKLNQIELFSRFGLIAKSIVLTSKGGRTEDMKLFHVDFDEITRTEIIDSDGIVRPYEFEDSDLYSYFSDHEFLCIIFQEPEFTLVETQKVCDYVVGRSSYDLSQNQFVGFKRLVFGDEFIDTVVRGLWDDIRDKVMGNKLVDVVKRDKNGNLVINPNGEVSSAPNFMKSSQNTVFLRGSGTDSSYKTEVVNDIKMLPQYVWIKGSAVVDALDM